MKPKETTYEKSESKIIRFAIGFIFIPILAFLILILWNIGSSFILWEFNMFDGFYEISELSGAVYRAVFLFCTFMGMSALMPTPPNIKP